MKIMVAFLGNKKKNVKTTINSSNFDRKQNNINFIKSINNNYNTKEKKENYRKSTSSYLEEFKLKNENYKSRENKKVLENCYKNNVIHVNVVGTRNISLNNSYSKIDKQKVKNNIEALVYKTENYKLWNNKQSNKKRKLKFQNFNDKCNSKKSTYRIFSLINFFLIILSIIIVVGANSGIVWNVLLKFSTNFRQAENFNFEITEIIKTCKIYNKANYIVNENVPQVIEKADIAEVIVTSDEEIIDNEAKISYIETFFDNNINVQITENSNSIQRVTVGSTNILNYSSKRDIDYKNLINSDVILTKKSDKILLYNTHTSESYINSDGYKFDYTGTMRTTDANYNMLEIAKKLNENLRSKGFESIQDTTPHDYGTYTSAYSKSRITVKNALKSMSGAGIIIDVHRDASSDLAFRPVTNIKDVQVAKLMFVVGVGSNTNKNDNWQDNLKLALKLQIIADKIYPGLFRPMIIRNSVYNQDLNKYALLVEFGATGNTIEEVKLSTRCMTNLLNIMYKD